MLSCMCKAKIKSRFAILSNGSIKTAEQADATGRGCVIHTDPEVAQLRMAALRKQNVLGLKVTIDDIY